MCDLFLNLFFIFLVNMKNPESDSLSEEETGEESQVEFSQTQLRLNYVLFLLPLVVVFGVVSIMYIKHYIRNRIRNLIQLLDNHMDMEDADQTPVKVLEMMDGIESDDGDLTSDLIWDDSIEKNAQILIDEISDQRKEVDPKDQDNDHSSISSVIAVNLEDYLVLFNAGNTSIRDDLPVTNNQLPISSSTPIIAERNSNSSRSEDSQRNSLSKYLSSPEHFPSFNVNILGSDSESSQDECDLKVQSKTRSGRIYKTV